MASVLVLVRTGSEVATRASDGDRLDGGSVYRLTVPPNVPAAQYWSATLYNRDRHTLIRDVAR